MKPFGYIYLINNLANEKVYVGKTESTIKTRWYTHKWRADHLDRIENPLVVDIAIAKYGENSFEIKQLDKAFKKEDLLRAEANWIKFYNSTNPEKGYNIDPMHWIDDEYYIDDIDDSIWQVPTETEERRKKKEQWRESLIKKRIPPEMEELFKKDLRNLSGVQLERKYGLKNNRRALHREIRRILKDSSIKTMEQAKIAVKGEPWNPRKRIPIGMQEQFIEDFKTLSGFQLEIKYNMTRPLLCHNIKEIFKECKNPLLDNVHSLEEIKIKVGGRLYSETLKAIQSEQEREFIRDVREGMRIKAMCNKYNIGTGVFYRELERLLNIKELKEIRPIEYDFPKREQIYIPQHREDEFKIDSKTLSGAELQNKYGILDRRILFREARRIFKTEQINSMKDLKELVGGELYNLEAIKTGISLDKEQEFKNDVQKCLSRRKLCEKYNLGTKALYRELQRICNTRSLEEARKKEKNST